MSAVSATLETGGVRLLVAEDDAITGSMLEDILSGEGYHIDRARDGYEALERATGETLPDLVLLDIMMPKLDGFEVCQRVKEAARNRHRYLPVLVLTAMGHREARLRGLSLGADDYLTKPFDRTEVLLRVRGLLTVKQLHDENLRRYDELKRLESMQRRLTEFVVHDLKNPLTGLLANLQLLDRETSANGSPRARGFLRDAGASAHKLLEMVTTLLDVARMEDGNMSLRKQAFSLGEIIKVATHQFEALSRFKDLALEMAVDPELPVLHGDADVISRVIGNLLSNAIKHSPPGRVIRVEGRVSAGKRDAEIRVVDEGAEIPEDHREQIFEKFARIETPDKTPGHGLGLTFCRLAARAHGGDCRCEPGPSGGNAFVVTLPVAS